MPLWGLPRYLIRRAFCIPLYYIGSKYTVNLMKKLPIRFKSIPFFGLCLLLLSACGDPGEARDISPAALAQQLDNSELLILDVRTPGEYAAGHVPGAENIPHTELGQHLERLDAYRDKPVVLYCKSGRRAAMAEEILGKAGFKQLLHLDGDMDAWQAGGFPQQK